jgi:NAD(P)-dependent dehydrogenase (short-subunit alcohol dehydrogenase family)
MNTPYELTVDGFERQWQVNYVSPHVLDQLFLQHLLTAASIHERQDRVRVIHVSSDLARMGPETIQLTDPNMSTAKGPMAPRNRYCHSKQATIRDVWDFNKRYSEKGVTAYSVHPGIVKTGLQAADPSFVGNVVRTLVNIGGGTPLEGCRNSLFCATSAQAPAIGQGKFFLPVGKVDGKKEDWFHDEKVNSSLWEHGQSQLRRLGTV